MSSAVLPPTADDTYVILPRLLLRRLIPIVNIVVQGVMSVHNRFVFHQIIIFSIKWLVWTINLSVLLFLYIAGVLQCVKSPRNANEDVPILFAVQVFHCFDPLLYMNIA